MAHKKINFGSIGNRLFSLRDSIGNYRERLEKQYGIDSDLEADKDKAESEEQYRLLCILESLSIAEAALEETIEKYYGND